MNKKFINILLKKEFLEIVRNRRALYEMILIPLFLTPVLTLGIPALLLYLSQQFFEEKIIEKIPIKQVSKEVIVRGQAVYVKNEEIAPEFVKVLKESRSLRIVKVKNPEEALRKQEIQIYIEFPKKFEEKFKKGEKLNLIANLKLINLKTIFAYIKLQRIVEHFNQLREKKLEKTINRYNPLKIQIVNKSSSDETLGFVLGLCVPLFIIFWLMMGGNSIAIDLTTAERERKTLELLFLAPIKKQEIFFSKFIVNLIVSLLSVFLAFSGMIASFLIFWVYLPESWKVFTKDFVPSFSLLFLLFIATILLSGILNCLQLILSTLAKSIKEAEYYLYPLVLVIMVPGIFAEFTEISLLSNLSFLVPLINICYLMREILLGIYNGTHLFLTIFSSIISIFILFKIGLKFFSRENILFTD